MAGIKDFFKFLQRDTIEIKEAPQVVLSVNNAHHYRKDNYEAYADEGYRQNAVVYRCINEIANGAACIPFKLFQGDDELDQHPLLALLKRPNPSQAGVEYFQAVYSYLLLSGNNYAIRSDVGGEVRELYLLRPDRVRVKPSKTSTPEAYEYVLGGKVVKTYDADPITGESEVKHMKLYNPLDDYYGLSPLMAAAVDIDNHNAINKHNISLLNNGARPSGAIVFKPQSDRGLPIQLSDGQRQQLRDDLNVKYTGAANAGKPLLLEGDFDWREMGLTPKDMDFLQQRNMAAKDIALCFGVPSQLIGIPDAQTYANVQEARLALYEETIMPLARRVQSDLNEWLAPVYGEEIRIEYDFEAVPAMVERRRRIYENVTQAVREGIISRNEARERLGLEPIQGGDDVYIAANLFPLGSTEAEPTQGQEAEQDAEKAYGIIDESKAKVAKDVFTTESEAQARAEEIGCFGTHFHDTDNGKVYMPCASHADYRRLTGTDLTTPKQSKERVARDVFTTEDEAAERAEEIGCFGTHFHDTDNGRVFMPCASHADYRRLVGEDLETPKQDEELGDDAKAESDVDTTPTDAMAKEAERGLAMRKEFNRGGTEVGVARAVQLVSKERLSPRTVRRMHSFFSRHEVDKRAEGFRRGEEGYPSAGKIAWLLWGGDAGQTWARRTAAKLDKERDGKNDILEDIQPIDNHFEEKAVKISESVKKGLAKKVKEHNDKHGDKKGKRVTLRMLSAVFRRGVGAYNTNPSSVRPSVSSSDQWAYARVNVFLGAVRTGRFKRAKFDTDLLPKGHPLRTGD
jgi:HK97 family phage portal protein